MELRDLTMFVRVVEDGNFSAAAQTLSLTPSTVSKSVARLEKQVGRRLFQRSSRRMQLTHEGQRLLDIARRVIDALSEVETVNPSAPSGLLRIRSLPTFACYQLAPLIPAFRKAYPLVGFEFILGNDRIGSLDDGADIAIASGPVPDSSLVSRKIGTSRWIVCASPTYLAERGVPASPAELGDHECLNFTAQTPWNDWSEVSSMARGEIARRAGIAANNGDMLRALAIAGGGIVRLAEFHISEDLRAGRLVALFAETAHEQEPIYAIYQAKRHMSPRVRAFLDFLYRSFAKPLWTPTDAETTRGS